MAKSSIYADVLKDYSAWLEEKKPKLSPKKLPVYEELKEKLQAYVTTAETFENNPTNCTLRHQAYTLLFDIAHIRNVLRRQEVNEIFLRHTETSQDAKFEEIKKNLLENDLPSAVRQVENFIASLDAVGREENQDLINWFNVLQTKTTDKDKLAAFHDILEIFLNEYERETKAGHVNCRLTVFRTSYKEIIRGVLNTYFTELNQDDEA
uniref:BAH domain protein n=1 Tax=Musca domestica TaxID=7370 RepID=T1PDH8_MUSDO